MNGVSHLEPDFSEFVEVDPTGRYGRYNEILGKGASKTVYRAFDEYQGIEVAWNQVKLYDFLQSPEDLERLYCEIHLLKTLKHKNIMKFYTSWVDIANRNINFVTEMFTSGTLRQYRLKHKRVNIRAVKHWCRQILKGLVYLHSLDPPVIHRDLKCDNIFINGNQGVVKIGDLGLAAILKKSHAAHCVGTPEFMAPEVYEEAYNELVDIYSFGMCILEMVTFEYPYSECTHPAQIYKKVTSGKKPDALYKVNDPEVRQFVEKCLATVSLRLSARELLDDPFLRIDDNFYNMTLVDSRDFDDLGPYVQHPFLNLQRSYSNLSSEYSNYYGNDAPGCWYSHPVDTEPSGVDLFENHDDDPSEDVDISIRGRRKDDGSIFLRLRIGDKEGRIRNIHFPFDVEMDTALSVATEMVAELDITDQDVTRIADMIDGEIVSLVPEWRPGPGIEESPRFSNQKPCDNCALNHISSSSFPDFRSHNLGANNCCGHGCASMHGRFEEIMFQPEYEDDVKEDGPNTLQYHELWKQQESCEITPVDSEHSHSDEQNERIDRQAPAEVKGQVVSDSKIAPSARHHLSNLSDHHYLSTIRSLCVDLEDKCGREIQQELRWLRASYQIELRELRDRQFGMTSKFWQSSNRKHSKEYDIMSLSLSPRDTINRSNHWIHSKSLTNNWSSGSSCHSLVNANRPNSDTQRDRTCEAMNFTGEEGVVSTHNLYAGPLLPPSLRRTVSLPVDAVDV